MINSVSPYSLKFTLKQLRQTAKSMNLIRVSSMRKADLEALIRDRLASREIDYKYLAPKIIFKEFISTRKADWDCSRLQHLTAKFLKSLCTICGFKKSGTKQQLISILTVGREMFIKLADYSKDNLQQLAASFKGSQLKEMIRTARIANKCGMINVKYAMAASLISWRDGCVARGARNYKEAIAQIKKQRQKQQQTESTVKRLVKA